MVDKINYGAGWVFDKKKLPDGLKVEARAVKVAFRHVPFDKIMIYSINREKGKDAFMVSRGMAENGKWVSVSVIVMGATKSEAETVFRLKLKEF